MDPINPDNNKKEKKLQETPAESSGNEAAEQIGSQPETPSVSEEEPPEKQADSKPEPDPETEKKLREMEAMLALQMQGRPKGVDRQFGCFSCLLGFILLSLIVTIISANYLLNALNKGMISDNASTSVPISLTTEEKADLDRQLADYQAKVEEARQTGKEIEFTLSLTGNQANTLLTYTDDRIREHPEFSMIRVFPNGSDTQLILSAPYDKNRFINAIVNGEPRYENGAFTMKINSLKAGKMENLNFMREGVLKKGQKLASDLPRYLNLPFNIQKMFVENDKVIVTVKILPQPRG